MGAIDGETVTPEQEKTAAGIWYFLDTMGFNDKGKAAVIGNAWSESKLHPNACQNSSRLWTYYGGSAVGLWQWDGYKGEGRKKTFFEFVENKTGDKANWTDMQNQLDYFKHEYDNLGYKEKLQTTPSSIEEATIMFCDKWEVAGTKKYPQRIEAAYYFYNLFKGTKGDPDGIKSGAGSTPGSSESSGESGGGYEEDPKLKEDGASEEPFESFFKNGYLDFGENMEIPSMLMDEFIKLHDKRRIRPLSVYDNVEYGSRYNIQNSGQYNLILGDCCFTVPPEFINISSESSTQSIVTLRQESTRKIKNGYTRRTIIIDLVFHGLDQINGYKVEGPEGWYYVDGLRQLLAEFKCTPFLPVTNWTINATYNIFTVALQSIVVSTLPGYPDVLTANLTLQEVDLFPYIEVHPSRFSSMIDWDLFRFYYQRQLTEKNEYGKLKSIPAPEKARFRLSILNEDVFSSDIDYGVGADGEAEDDMVSFYDIVFDRKIVKRDKKTGKASVHKKKKGKKNDTNFVTYIDSEEDECLIEEFHAGYSNILTNIQMAENPHPVMQYMGGMDTTFQISFQTTNDGVISKLQELTAKNDQIIRDNRDYTGIGFVKIDSELVQFMGSKFVVIDSIGTNTSPGFPGLYSVQINCICFDAYQKEQESIQGHTPFPVDEQSTLITGKGSTWTDAPGYASLGSVVRNQFTKWNGMDVIDREPVDKAHPHDGKGIKYDAITQNMQGLDNKVRQDLTIEQKMRMDVELYPDLKLPTYAEVDAVIKKIRKFRKTHKNRFGSPLSLYPLKQYPRTPQRMMHGIAELKGLNLDRNGFATNVSECLEQYSGYDVFVDPDFYVFYPETYKGIMNEDGESLEKAGYGYEPPHPEARTTTITQRFPRESWRTDSDVGQSSAGTSEFINDGSARARFVELARSKVGRPYVWGADGANDTYDCSGLVSWCGREVGIPWGRQNTASMRNDCKGAQKYFRWKYMNQGNDQDMVNHASPGDLFLNGHHVGIYVGNGMHVEAKGSRWGVVEATPIGRHYDGVVEIVPFANDSSVMEDTNKSDSKKSKKKSKKSKKADAEEKMASDSETGGNGGEVQDVYSKKTKKKLKTEIDTYASTARQDSEKDVKTIQKALNQLRGAGLKVDGKYGPETEKAVTEFQKWYSKKYDKIKIDGIVGPETSRALTKALKRDYQKSSVKPVTDKERGKGRTITKDQLEKIAKTMAKKYYGKASAVYMAMAQTIYDRATDPNKKWGSVDNILSSRLFDGMTEKDISKTTAYESAKAVFCGTTRMFKERSIYFKGRNEDGINTDKYDKLGSYGKFTFYTDGKESSKTPYKLIDGSENIELAEIDEDAYQVQIETGVTDFEKSMVKDFGRPLLIRTSEMNRDNSGMITNLVCGIASLAVSGLTFTAIKPGDVFKTQANRYDDDTYNTPKNILCTSFCNQVEYSGKGRLVKAFPTYFFSIVDEEGGWLDGRKLWANYYFLRSLVEIQAVSYDDNPMTTATITISNSYGNLNHRSANDYTYSPLYDSEYNTLQKWLYKHFNILPSITGAKLTKELVERRNIVSSSMMLRAGCRCHLRMGYGSDPLGLPVVLNGHISDLSSGDIITIVCVSDGVELMNDIISDNPKAHNTLFKSQESSNMVMDLLCKRTSFLNSLLPAYFEASEYGIEHFGLYFSKHVNIFGEANNGESATGFSPLQVGAAVINAGANIIEDALTIVKGTGSSLFGGWKTLQYDLCKNIYRGNYKAELAFYSPFWGFIDDEKNIVYSQYNKTPWDTIQVATQNCPEFVGMPITHQFESRMFLGLPYWHAKYRYDMINNSLYEEAKTFAQCHFIDSLTEIIDNQMRCTSRDVHTNAIVMYTRGKSPHATPTLYSDRTIDTCYQATKIYDSSVTQNWIGPDAFWEAIGVLQGQKGAVRLGISQLIINWSKAYKGDVLILGDAGINPNDYMYMSDRFNDINGLCIARCVTHTLSSNTGFVTTFTPGMIAMSTLDNSQAGVTYSNWMMLCNAFSYAASVKKIRYQTGEKNALFGVTIGEAMQAIGYATSNWVMPGLIAARTAVGAKHAYEWGKAFIKLKKLADVGETGGKMMKFISALDKTKDALSGIKGAAQAFKTIGSMGEVGTAVKGLWAAVKAGGATLGGANGLNAAVASAGGVAALNPVALVAAIVVCAIISRIIKVVIDYFKYRNCIKLLPMIRRNMSYVPIFGNNLLLTSSDDSRENNEMYQSGTDAEGAYGKEYNKANQSGDDDDYSITPDEENNITYDEE